MAKNFLMAKLAMGTNFDYNSSGILRYILIQIFLVSLQHCSISTVALSQESARSLTILYVNGPDGITSCH